MKKDKEISLKDILTSNEEIDLIVEREQLKNILTELDNGVDDEGFIIDLKTGKRVIGQDEGEIKLGQLGGVLSGSKVFIKKNIASLSEFLAEKRKQQ